MKTTATPSIPLARILSTMVLLLMFVFLMHSQTAQELQAVRKARADAAYLEYKGELEEALQKYEESYKLLPDQAVAKKIENLRVSLGKVNASEEEFFNDDTGVSKLCPGPLNIKVLNASDQTVVKGIPVRVGARLSDTDSDGVATFDGIPEGKYKGVIKILGFDLFETWIELPEGDRNALEWVIQPETRSAEVSGTVVVKDLDLVLAGAQVDFVPTKVASSIQGPISFQTDWSGNFLMYRIPTGEYEATVRAEGCKTLTQAVKVEGEKVAFRFGLERITADAACEITVTDAVSRRPVPGANVTLSEAWPVGTISKGTSNAAGKVLFNNLKTGRINWIDTDGNCTVARKNVTVHVEKDGYAAFTDPVVIGPNSKAQVLIYPVREVKEQESNDGFAAAQLIDPGAIVKFTIDKNPDEDWFKLHLPHSGQLQLEIGPDNPIQTYMTLYNGNGEGISSSGAYPGQVNRITVQAGSGDYIVQISEWNKDNCNPGEMELRVNYIPVPDPMYPNNSPEEARLVRANEEFRGYEHPVSDVEYYRFEVKRPSGVRITNSPAPYQRYVRLLNGNGDAIAGNGAYGDQQLHVESFVKPGLYMIEVTEWNRDNCSLAPNSSRLEVIEDDQFDDDPVEPVTAIQSRTLALDSLVANTIYPLKDVDYYQVAIPGPGVFRVNGTSVTKIFQRILSMDGRVLAQAGAYPNQVLGTEYHANQAETVLLEMTEWNSDSASTSPYTLWNSFIPSDENDSLDRNETTDVAIPFTAGEVLRGSINPIKDLDMYSFHMDRPGWFDGKVENDTQLSIRIYDAKQKLVGEWGWYPQTHPAFSLPLLPGDYFLEVTEWNSDSWSPVPYAVHTAYRYADENEATVLKNSSVTRLKLNETTTFKIEQIGDLDRFHIDLPKEGVYSFRVNGPLQLFSTGKDALTGKVLFQFRAVSKCTPFPEF